MRLLSFVTSLLALAFMAIPAMAETVAACPPPSWKAQAGELIFSPFNITAALVSVMLVVSFFYLFGRTIVPFLAALFFLLPTSLYEFLGYAIAFGLMAAKLWLPEAAAGWGTLVGCLSLAGMISYSAHTRKWEGSPAGFCGTLFVAWTAVALVTGYHMIGFISVGAFMGMLGFVAGSMPFGYFIGFKDDDAVVRGTWAAFMTLAAFAVMQVFGGHVPVLASYTSIFDEGVLWWGGIVGFGGLLILSSGFYRGTNWIAMQVLTIVMCWAAILVGYNIGVEYLLKTGMTAFVLWMVAKPWDLEPEGMPAVMTMAFFWSVAMGFGLWGVYTHQEFFQHYLLFV